jgi:hypothetical protein
MSSFHNTARQDASAIKNVKLFLGKPLLQSRQGSTGAQPCLGNIISVINAAF